MTVGYLGPKNSFTYQATKKLFSKDSLCPYASIPLCIAALAKEAIDYAIVPIENSLEGSVNMTTDGLFGQNEFTVAGEIILPISQQLMALTTNNKIRKIISHPQALAQSAAFLESHYPEVPLEAAASTTAAAKYVLEHPEEDIAAIASKQAANEYKLTILAEDIQENPLNQTRFWVLTKKMPIIESLGKPVKTTFFLTLPSNQPGSLHTVLSAFSWRKINLSKIESRPLKTSLGEYFFVIDVVLDQPWQLIENALEEISLLNGKIQQLGRYPVKVSN